MPSQQDRAILVWSVFFVVSGLVFLFAFFFSPVIGALVTLAFITLYVGLSAVFVLVFREIESVRRDTLARLRDRKGELEDIKRALQGKYFKKKIGGPAFEQALQDYERKLTEIEVKIRRLQKRR